LLIDSKSNQLTDRHSNSRKNIVNYSVSLSLFWLSYILVYLLYFCPSFCPSWDRSI